jgi:hypothetical protein
VLSVLDLRAGVKGWDEPERHVGSRDCGELDGAGETLVTLRIVVLEADLELDRLEEVSLLLVQRIVEKLLHILAHSGWFDWSVMGLKDGLEGSTHRL